MAELILQGNLRLLSADRYYLKCVHHVSEHLFTVCPVYTDD